MLHVKQELELNRFHWGDCREVMERLPDGCVLFPSEHSGPVINGCSIDAHFVEFPYLLIKRFSPSYKLRWRDCAAPISGLAFEFPEFGNQ